MSQDPIYVTRPHLPPLEEFIPLLEKIWDSRILTNKGPFARQFEEALCDYLGVEHVALCANGTLALVMALRAAGIQGQVITTPYSFVATSHALQWCGLEPVFVDIDEETLCMNPAHIEAAISPKTRAILPVHVYGNPCDGEAIAALASRHELPVVYDAAHAFGVESESGNLYEWGDFTALSFHATKVFNTFEGGAIVCPDAAGKEALDRQNNFGFVNETTVASGGINGKLDEFRAALGLLQLEHIADAISRRGEIDRLYREGLAPVPGIRVLDRPGQRRSNFAYFTILVESGFSIGRDALYERLKSHGIYCRRYFYPLIANLPMYRELPSADPARLAVANRVSEQVLCLPIYPLLVDEEVHRVIDLISGA